MGLPSAGSGGNFGAKKLSSIQQFKSPCHQANGGGGGGSNGMGGRNGTFDGYTVGGGSISQTTDDSLSFDQPVASQRDEQKRRIYELSAEALALVAHTKIGNWFSWCQTCKHGGHIKHLIDWFRVNQKCPYLHCECECTSIDFVY